MPLKALSRCGVPGRASLCAVLAGSLAACGGGSGTSIEHDLPFADYTLNGDHVDVHTAAGDIHVSIGPWGAHVGPHTGHLEGNPKADWLGQYAWELADLAELDGDSDGVCEGGETCGIHRDELEARAVDYVAPVDGLEVIMVRLENVHPPDTYYGTQEQWRVRAKVGRYTYSFIHLRGIADDLRTKMIDAGYVDPETVASESGNLITGAPVPLDRGDAIAQPQIIAEQLPAPHDDHYTGKWDIAESPHQQMEFFTSRDTSESFYTWLPDDLEADLAAVLEAEGNSPTAFRYNQPFLTRWRWAAEMKLSNAPRMDRDDYSDIFSALGGWWESTGGPCPGSGDPMCDELFAIYPIQQDTDFHDPALYDEPGVAWLANWTRAGEPTRYGQVVEPGEPDPVAGTMVIRWETFGGTFIGYQGIGYRLDSAGRTLRILWGQTASMPEHALPIAIPDNDDTCNGSSLTCHDHEWNGFNVF